MGTYLSTPNTDKESNDGEDGQFKFGVAAMQGWRVSMEDAHSTILNVKDNKGQPTSIGFFGVFDGHGGKEVAMFAAKHLASELVRTDGWNKGNLEEAIQQAYMNLDANLGREDNWDELSKFAAEKQAHEIGEDEDEAIDGPDTFSDSLKTALMARYAGLNPDDDPNWDGDDCEDPPFDPMVALEDGKVQDISDMDVMTHDSEEEEEEEEEAVEVHSNALITGKDEHGGSEEEATSSDSEGGPGLQANPLGGINRYLGPSAGCTAVVALIANDMLVVANAGDSRCVVSRNGTAHAMTTDHKPTDDQEAARIQNAGGWVTGGRVNGSLNLSRAFGDMEFKCTPELTPAQQMITADPEIRTLKLAQGDEFLVLACDGIWDVLSNQEAVDFVRERLGKGTAPRAICEDMCDRCLAPDAKGDGEGCDNMSVMVVVLKNYAGSEASKGVPVPQVMPPPGP